MELRAPIHFFMLFGASLSPEKVQHFLVSPNSIKLTPNGLCFGAAMGSEVPFMLDTLHQNQHFFEGPTHPSQN